MARILCVEDDITNRVLMREMLRRAGYEVVEVSDGDSALALLEREAIDLIVMDLRLPGMNGMDVIRRIRQTPEIAQLPILALTADSYSHDESYAAGCDEYMNKPVHPRHFIQTIERLLRL